MGFLSIGVRKVMVFFENIACVLLVLITVFGFVNVVLRYVFAMPISWNEEMSVLALAWMVYLSQGLLEADNNQLRMTALFRLLKGKPRTVINIFRSLLTIGISVCFLYAGAQLAYRNYAMETVTQSLGVPLWIAYTCIPFAFACIIIVRAVDPLIKFAQGSK